ncbi:MAG: class I poly(R)-hydroxyalkanoic acid synthase [Hyphomonadaceae bacterium]
MVNDGTQDEDATSADASLMELLAAQTPEQLQTLSATLLEASKENAGLMQEMMQAGPLFKGAGDDHFGAGKSFARLGKSLAAHPGRIAEANTELWQGWMKLWQGVLTGKSEPSTDRRFADPEWTTNPAFSLMRQAYELNTNWLMSLIDNADDMAEDERHRTQFFARQITDAIAPSNFFATNPAALKTMIQTGGASVLTGLQQARRDMKRGNGKLNITQVDESPFELGHNLATTPGKVIFRNDLIELIQYAPTTKKTFARPLLIFPPFINKFYILDLKQKNSMIRWLVDKGLTVFIVSWRSADEVTKNYDWDDYVDKGIFAAIKAACKASGAKRLNTVGYCIGGTLLSSALAWKNKKRKKQGKKPWKRIASSTFFASQSDFKIAGDLLVFANKDGTEHYQDLINKNGGIMPGEAIGETFNWLRPVDLVWRYVVDNYMLGKPPKAFDLLYWNADTTNLPGPTQMTYIRQMYGANDLGEGRFKVKGTRVKLGDIKLPIMVQAGRDDHICPYNSVYRTAKLYGGQTQFILAGSGHIAGVANHPDSGKYQHWVNAGLPASPETWLAGSDEIKGSWWPSWWKWLEPQSGKQVKAVKPKDQGLGDAPGTYVKVRLEDIHAARGS